MPDSLSTMTLPERAVSAFPLSIGTSLAFESVFPGRQPPFDPDRQIPVHVDLTQYNTCWINITTLFRNMSSALDKETFLGAKPAMLAATLEEEISVIQSLFEMEGNNTCKVELYYSTYDKLMSRKVLGLDFRTPSTDGQRFYHGQLQDTLKLMERHTDTIQKMNDGLMPVHRSKAFVLTHQPYDLTHWNRFDHLDLLESNTGLLKPRSTWGSKFYPMSGQSFAHLPFHRKLLLIFGDKSLIKPMSMILRKQILDISVAYDWKPNTTMEKINLNIGLAIKDPFTLSILHAL